MNAAASLIVVCLLQVVALTAVVVADTRLHHRIAPAAARQVQVGREHVDLRGIVLGPLGAADVPPGKVGHDRIVTTLANAHPAGADSITTVSAIPPGSLVQIGTGWAHDVEVRRTGDPFTPLVYPHMPGEPVVVLPGRVCEPLCDCPECGLFGHHLFGKPYSMVGGVGLIDRECRYCGRAWTETMGSVTG